MLNITAHDFEHDCNNCQGLCCVATIRSKQAGYDQHYEVGVPCPKLTFDSNCQAFSCSVHDILEQIGGGDICAGYTCGGAGQQVSSLAKELGINWSDDEVNRADRYELFKLFIWLQARYQRLKCSDSLDAVGLQAALSEIEHQFRVTRKFYPGDARNIVKKHSSYAYKILF